MVLVNTSINEFLNYKLYFLAIHQNGEGSAPSFYEPENAPFTNDQNIYNVCVVFKLNNKTKEI